MSKTDALVHEYLRNFAEGVKSKMALPTPGEREAQLRPPFEKFITSLGDVFEWNVGCKDESTLPDRLGRPDFAIHRNQLLVGYVELKAPGKGADSKRFTDRDSRQFKHFSNLPNVLYTDGCEWALYRTGKLARNVKLSGDIVAEGKKAVSSEDAIRITPLLADFLQWKPFINDKTDLKQFAGILAPLCRMLRDDVTEALSNPGSPLVRLAADWRQLLFPDASDERFADAYAQTVTFALLLGRCESKGELTLKSAEAALASGHGLLSKALTVLTDGDAGLAISASLDMLTRVIDATPGSVLSKADDLWLYFYEDFLAAYDPKLRKNVGVYYTPVEVVRAQVRLIDDILVNQLGEVGGFASRDVLTLDPAVGTGTYLLGIIEHALGRVRKEKGEGAVPGKAAMLARNLYGFELLVGPYSVAELRTSRALRGMGARIPSDGTHIYLTDTLESPRTVPASLPYFLKAISDQHARALEVKRKVPVLVCIGNPPYDRHEADNGGNHARTGAWVRWGDDGVTRPVLQDFIDPAIAAGHGKHVKNLYNLYVYFWRWALWKVFESETATGPGVVSFISASSYLDGDAFAGMRKHMREQCDEIWILDLGGEGRGTRKSDNVFDIQTPVTIAVAFRMGKASTGKPASVNYFHVEGTREEKLEALDRINGFRKVKWQKCPSEWLAPFKPAGKGQYFKWPLLTDLMPWQQAGVKAGRTWVIGPEKELLAKSWATLLMATGDSRRELFKNSPTGRKVNESIGSPLTSSADVRTVASLPKGTPAPRTIRFSFRSLDRQFILADGRVLDRPGPKLWHSYGKRQVYLTSQFTAPLGQGPAAMASSCLPDSHYFSGRGGKDIVPLFRDSHAADPNILPGLLDLLGKRYKRSLTPEDFLAYVYGLLAQPAFTGRFHKELETRELRVPLTADAKLFERARAAGARLLWLHTYGERMVPKGQKAGHVPRGKAKCRKEVPGSPDEYPVTFRHDDKAGVLYVGEGEFSPVPAKVFNFEVSGLYVVQSWLKYRMKKGAGKKSSPLDDIRPECWTEKFTDELLELLWVLEATLEGYPEQEEILEAVIEGPCIGAEELPPVPGLRRKPPTKTKSNGNGELFDGLD